MITYAVITSESRRLFHKSSRPRKDSSSLCVSENDNETLWLERLINGADAYTRKGMSKRPPLQTQIQFSPETPDTELGNRQPTAH